VNQLSADLDKEMKQAQLEEFGPDPGVATFPSKFFRSDVYVYQGDPDGKEKTGTRTQVRPRYCATNYGADLVSTVLGDAAEIVNLCPLNPAGLQFGWQTTADTPYLIFEGAGGKQGAPINAGFLLDYWTHGYPADLALQMAQMEVDGSFA